MIEHRFPIQPAAASRHAALISALSRNLDLPPFADLRNFMPNELDVWATRPLDLTPFAGLKYLPQTSSYVLSLSGEFFSNKLKIGAGEYIMNFSPISRSSPSQHLFARASIWYKGYIPFLVCVMDDDGVVFETDFWPFRSKPMQRDTDDFSLCCTEFRFRRSLSVQGYGQQIYHQDNHKPFVVIEGHYFTE